MDEGFKKYVKQQINNDKCPSTGGLLGFGASKDCGEYELTIEKYNELKPLYDKQKKEHEEGHQLIHIKK